MPNTGKGAVVIVGTGIQLINHMTHEARLSIMSADKVLHVVTDHLTQRYIETLNPNSQSLNHLYGEGKPRQDTYQEMADAIMEQVRAGFRVCAVFYGHPGVFVSPSHEVIKVATSEGYEARMLPGISAEDCLFADLGVDPGSKGCQSFEATDFLVHRKVFDPTSALVLWQIGALGITDAIRDDEPGRHIEVLIEVLQERYGAEHEIVIYEASTFPYPSGPFIQRTTIGQLAQAKIPSLATLYIPPLPPVVDEEMMRRLGLGHDGLSIEGRTPR